MKNMRNGKRYVVGRKLLNKEMKLYNERNV
jgi:hypothetical protein